MTWIGEDFLVRALLAGLGVALIAGPLGCFVVWRRMAYFGDTLAHSALLGVTLGFLLHIELFIGVATVCLVLALLLNAAQSRWRIANDTLLGILSHSALSLGLVLTVFMEGVRIDLMAYLFGDILSVNVSDLGWIWGGGVVALIILITIWRPMLAVTLHEDLARVEGVPVERVRLGFILLLALVVAAALKVVGVLLITSLLIIPAAAARRIAHTPEQMAFFAALIGGSAVLVGLGASRHWDTPSGPSIVLAAAVIFLLFGLVGRLRRSD